MNNGWNTNCCGIIVSKKYRIEIEAVFLLQCSKIMVEGLEFEQIGGLDTSRKIDSKLKYNLNFNWIFSWLWLFIYIYITKS